MIRRWKDSFAQAFLRENLFYGVLFLNKKGLPKLFRGKKHQFFTYLSVKQNPQKNMLICVIWKKEQLYYVEFPKTHAKNHSGLSPTNHIFV